MFLVYPAVFFTACWIAVPTSAINWSVFFFFFLLVTGKSPEEKAQLIFISTPPNIPHSSSLLYSYYSVLSLYLSISPSSVLGG